MYSSSRTVIKWVVWIGMGMLVIVTFHIGGRTIALPVGQFSPLVGAFIGASLTLFSASSSLRKAEGHEPWLRNEQLAWILIGCGVLMWGIGESFWRYFVATGQAPFPSQADIGYFSFPLLAFVGLLMQPPTGSGRKRLFLLLDSLISMGSILAIAWYLLLGSLAQAPGEANIAKFLGIYYPTSDTALLSCVVFLLLRGQGRAYQATARRVSLLVVGLGLCFFVFSDFIFNVQQNAGTYLEASWTDLGWPLGMMAIGLAAYLRRTLPVTPENVIEQRMQERGDDISFGAPQFIPYALLALLFLTLTLNVLTSDSMQLAIRPVLLVATFSVIGLVVVRQILTLRDNVRLTQKQAEVLEGLEIANQHIEEQSRQIAQHNLELEHGIEHLKEVQASLANGNLQARARLTGGQLLPLAGSLNLMAERLMRLGQTTAYARHLSAALGELSAALERYWNGAPLTIPDSCNNLVEINRLLLSLHIKGLVRTNDPNTQPLTPSPSRPLMPSTSPLPNSSAGHRSAPPQTSQRLRPASSPAPVSGPLETEISRRNEWKRR